MPRKIRTEPEPADIDAETAMRRARQLALRLRMCAPRDSDLRATIDRRSAAAEDLEPAERLEALLTLADEVRPALPEAVQRHTLPESINDWRTR
jgi:hypothetical protein